MREIIGRVSGGRKLTAAALRLAGERFAIAFRASPAAITLVRVADGKFIDVNESFLRLVEFNRDEVIGHTSSELGIVSVAEREPLMQRLREQGRLHNAEITARTKSGRPVHLLFSVETIQVAGESCHVATMIDITARTQAEGALRQSELRFNLAFHTSPAALTITRVADGKFVEVNTAFLRIFGFTREEVIGHTSTELQMLTPAAREKLIQQQRETGGLRDYELRARAKSGRPIDLLFSTQPLEIEGQPHHITTLIDITARKRAEFERQRFELLAESSSEFIGMCDLELNPIYVNPAGVRMVGLPDRAAACRVRVQDYFFPEDRRFITEEFFPRVLREGHAEVEIRLRHFQTGEPIWMLYHLFRVQDAGGTPVGWATVSRDITARRQAEETLRRSEGELRALALRLDNIREQERTAIAREIHDVLAQELTRLKIDLVWLTNRLTRPVDEAARKALAARVADATAQTDTAIATVQRIATELRPVILDSLGLAAAVEWQVEDFARRTGLACTADVPPGELPLERDRATALFRILQESLTNIARHAGATSVGVRLAAEPGAVVLTVHDDGAGIATAQLDDPHSIGLVGMRERMQAFGGTLAIETAPGAGTTIRARLPLGAPVP